jgi:transposase-like protein
MENQEKAKEQRAETRVQPESTIPEENRKRTPRWSFEEAQEVLDRWGQSGVSLLSFSRETGIGYQRLLAWRKKLNESESSDFVRINVAGTVGADIEIALTNGRIIRCGVGLDPRYLKTVIDLLER